METPVSLHVRLLGRFEVELDPGGPVTRWERPSARRLVALLALSGGRLRREAAAEELFPGLAPLRAANGVAKALSMARSALGADGNEVLAADRDWLWIGEGVTLTIDLDSHRGALEDALRQPPGPERAAALEAALATEDELLPEDLYADWTLPARRELDDLRERALLVRAQDLDAANQPSEARRTAWRRVLATDPESGEAAAALVALQFDASRHAVAPADDDGGGVGRELELARLRRALAGVERSTGPNLLVTGPTGIGKTHLLERLVASLESDRWIVLRGTAAEGDRDVPFAALRSALRPVADAAPPGSRLHAVLSTGGAASARGPDEDAAREQLASEVEGLLDAASAHAPALLVIDDAQWADDDLQRLLARVAARRTRRWALLVAARSDQGGAPPLLDTAERVELRPLTRALTEQLVRTLLPEGTTPAAVATLARRSGGNPFFAVELALSPSDGSASTTRGDQSLPLSIVDLLRHRLEGCTPGAQRLCRLVALMGGDAGYDLLLAVATDGRTLASEEAVTLAGEELLRRQLLVERPGGLIVAHPLVRDAILAATSSLARSALHSAIADGCADVGLEASVTAQHRLAAFESVRRRSLAAEAARAGFAAGLEARALYADATAVRLFERALDAFAVVPEPDRGVLRAAALAATIALGELLVNRNRLEAAAEQFEAAVALAEDDEERSRAWQAVALIAYRRGDLAAAAATYEQGLGALSADGGIPKARLLSDLAWVRYRREGPAEALDLMRDAAEQLDAGGDTREAAHAWDALAIALNDVGRTREALAASDTAFELCARVEDDRDLRRVLHLHRAPILGKAGRIYEGLAELDRVRRFPGGTAYGRSLTYWIETELHERRGDLESALAANDRELELLARLDNARHTAQALARRSVLLAGLRRPRDARDAARDARATALSVDDPLCTERVERILGGNETGMSRA